MKVKFGGGFLVGVDRLNMCGIKGLLWREAERRKVGREERRKGCISELRE